VSVRKEFRTGWLLLLLSDNPGYGYDLRRAMDERALELDRAVLYRSLRSMEHSGLIASRWARSRAGPRRRVYDITEAGLEELARIAARVAVARNEHNDFLLAFEQSGPPPAPERVARDATRRAG
jgi:PadR family transcriptional regulator PadR